MEKVDKEWCLKMAIEIIKERASASQSMHLAGDLEDVYKKIVELQKDSLSI